MYLEAVGTVGVEIQTTFAGLKEERSIIASLIAVSFYIGPPTLLMFIIVATLPSRVPAQGVAQPTYSKSLSAIHSAPDESADAHSTATSPGSVAADEFEHRWSTLTKYDPDVVAAIEEIEDLGESALLALKESFRVINDVNKISYIVNKIKEEPERKIKIENMDTEKLLEILNFRYENANDKYSAKYILYNKGDTIIRSVFFSVGEMRSYLIKKAKESEKI